MAQLTAKARRKLAPSQFALSGDRFPIEDVKHARAALSGAPRSESAGNITASEASVVERKANAFLNAHEGASRHADRVKSK